VEQSLQITFRNIPRSDALEADIREKAAKLDQFYEKVMACRVLCHRKIASYRLPEIPSTSGNTHCC